jgi:hypothetical protein
MRKENIGNNMDNPWRQNFSSHPQFEILESHVQRAVQDLFLTALREQTDDFICIFDSEDQIEEFCNKMISYWEVLEDYEKCSEIQKLSIKLKSSWSSSSEYYKKEQEVVLKEWLKSSF